MIDWGAKILENFTIREARCHGWEEGIHHDCGRIWLVDELCECLEAVRRAYGKPITVNSWLRCEAHNKAVGGVANSYHLNGRAVDIKPLDPMYLVELEWCVRNNFPWLKVCGTFIHCDIRGTRPGCQE